MNQNEVREQVAQAYTEALLKTKQKVGGSCCGSNSPQNAAAKLAGYEQETGLYGEATSTSFGCGNPLAFSGVEPDQTVLDLGSGAGLDLLIASDRVGPAGRVIGIDMTDAMLDAARAAAAKAGKTNIELRKGIIEDLPVEDSSVDWVISNCVINLSPDKPKVFSEIQRVLKPGGRFSISDIVVESLPDWIRNHAAAYAACIAGAISEAEYLKGLEAAGLSEVEVTDRLVYDADQISAVSGAEQERLGLDRQTLEQALRELSGKVWSAQVTGRK